MENICAQGDRVAMRVVEEGTHQGEWVVFPAMGKQITVACIAIPRIVDGESTQQWYPNHSGGRSTAIFAINSHRLANLLKPL
jgi:predicted ester cyclase